MTNQKEDKHEDALEYIFREMCSRVGADFDKLDMEKEDWADDHSWKIEDEIEFQVWLYNHLSNNPIALEAVSELPYINSDKVAKIVRNFCLFYGWAIESEFDVDYEQEFGNLDELSDEDNLEENNPKD